MEGELQAPGTDGGELPAASGSARVGAWARCLWDAEESGPKPLGDFSGPSVCKPETFPAGPCGKGELPPPAQAR